MNVARKLQRPRFDHRKLVVEIIDGMPRSESMVVVGAPRPYRRRLRPLSRFDCSMQTLGDASFAVDVPAMASRAYWAALTDHAAWAGRS